MQAIKIDAIGAKDHLICGPGVDTVVADSNDEIADDCENVSVRQLSPNQGPGNAETPEPPEAVE